MADLQVTQVQVFPVSDKSTKLKAFARVCLNDQLQLTSLRVYNGTKGLFVSFPNDTSYKGEDYKQIYYPVSKPFREHLEEAVLQEYENEIAETE